MPVTDTTTDPQALTLTLEAEFAAPVERVWQLWADPRKLEQWWGPPTWPATFERYEFQPGGQARYFMTGPDGTKAPGWWVITDVEESRRLEFDDGFSREDGEPVDPDDKSHTVVTLGSADGGTTMRILATFRDAEQMKQMVDMGMVEGLTEAVGQMDDLLVG